MEKIKYYLLCVLISGVASISLGSVDILAENEPVIDGQMAELQPEAQGVVMDSASEAERERKINAVDNSGASGDALLDAQEGKDSGDTEIVSLSIDALLSYAQGLGDGDIASQFKSKIQDYILEDASIKEKLGAAKSRSKIKRLIFGPDYLLLKEAKQYYEANKQRLTEIESDINSFAIESGKDKAIYSVSVLKEQNEKTAMLINDTAREFTILGWLMRWLNKY